MDSMNGSSVPPHCAVVEAGQLSSECPSSEWNFLHNWMSLLQQPLPESFQKKYNIFSNFAVAPNPVQLTGRFSSRQYLFGTYYFNTTFYEAYASISSTQQSVVTDALSSTASIWGEAVRASSRSGNHGATLNDQQKVVHSIANDYSQPYTSTLCLLDVIEGPNDRKNIAFPISPTFYERETELPLNITASISGYPAVEFPSIQRAQLLEIPGRESDYRVKWVQLSQSPLTHASVGLVVLLPKDPPTESMVIQTNTDIAVCNIQAGWGGSVMSLTDSEGGAKGSISSFPKADTSIGREYKQNADELELDLFQLTSSPLYFHQNPTYPSIPIEMDVEWAEYLNPFVPSINTTVIDFLLKFAATNGSKTTFPEIALMDIATGLVTNGLARSGFKGELQGNVSLIKTETNTRGSDDGNGNSTQLLDGNLWLSGKHDFFTVDPEESKDWVKLRVDSTIQGYAYNIDGPAPKLAIAFLLTYCCLALGHCFYSGISGISSTCWDSISEVTALAMNSPPTTVLRNTCAGITEIRIFRTPVRILTMRDQEGEGEHLEMVFGDIGDEESQNRAIKPNRKYGTMPAATKHLSLADEAVKLE
ncbi:hypothetical protein MMC07_004633 [Pseudocyphellaria aurata]|nr:hypothetical protein [Pseudocyphellaria aurata]